LSFINLQVVTVDVLINTEIIIFNLMKSIVLVIRILLFVVVVVVFWLIVMPIIIAAIIAPSTIRQIASRNRRSKEQGQQE
jgi:uncharacterized protein HemY